MLNFLEFQVIQWWPSGFLVAQLIFMNKIKEIDESLVFDENCVNRSEWLPNFLYEIIKSEKNETNGISSNINIFTHENWKKKLNFRASVIACF